MGKTTRAVVGVLALAVLACSQDGSLRYPDTHRIDHVDVYHGVEVADPYRWLEKDVREAEDVAAWVAEQNKVTFAHLESIAEREPIRKRLTELWNFERFTYYIKAGGRYYFTKNDGLQNQYVLYRMDSLDDEPQVLIDPNTWSKDGTAALMGSVFSDDGRYVAYSRAESGSDWQTIRVMEIASGEVLEDEIRWVKFSTPSWTADGDGFFYSRFDQPKEGVAFQGLNLNQKVYYHRVGTEQAADVLVYERPDHPDWMFGAVATEDGRYVIITAQVGTDERHRIFYRELHEPNSIPIELIDNFNHEYTFVGNDRTVFYFQTNLKAPRRRLIAVDLRRPAREQWKEIIPQAEETLESVSLINNLFVASYLKDASTRVRIHDMDGAFVREVDFGMIASADGFVGKRGDNETFYLLSSFTLPPSIYRYDLTTGKSTLMRRTKVDFDTEDYEVKQIFYNSKDGTRVPMFLAHRKGVKLDGSNATLLYGYGGFDISLTPHFSITRLAWMEMGGVLAIANLRGGGEYGEAWHKAGTKLQKQNVFDDFIAAAEWLIQKEYTRSSKLAIQGRSNGGLLVGAAITQRPELFGAALAGVGVMDMLRFHKFTAGRYWTDDYGSSDNPDEFKALYAYSPYHNLNKGVSYPATLVTTADTDDRVVPGHSFKFISQLQFAQAGEAPVLARIETRAGHGAGKPTSKLIEETANEWAFLVKNLGIELPSR